MKTRLVLVALASSLLLSAPVFAADDSGTGQTTGQTATHHKHKSNHQHSGTHHHPKGVNNTQSSAAAKNAQGGVGSTGTNQ